MMLRFGVQYFFVMEKVKTEEKILPMRESEAVTM
jgi:hypothetical protein